MSKIKTILKVMSKVQKTQKELSGLCESVWDSGFLKFYSKFYPS